MLYRGLIGTGVAGHHNRGKLVTTVSSSDQEQGGWAGTVLDAMKNDPTFWPDCDEDPCGQRATMAHTIHAGTDTATGKAVRTLAVYCDQHSALYAPDTRTVTVSPLVRPGEQVRVDLDMIGGEDA